MKSFVLQGQVHLPYHLNICLNGSEIRPIIANLDQIAVQIDFPLTMKGGALGKNNYPDGTSWLLIDTIWLVASCTVNEMYDLVGDDLEAVRYALQSAVQSVLRRFLNSYRWRLNQPQIHPVPIAPTAFRLELIADNGDREALPEPVDAFFYNTLPQAPPLESSITSESIVTIAEDVQRGIEPPHNHLFDLDRQWLMINGEIERAAELADWIADETVHSEGD